MQKVRRISGWTMAAVVLAAPFALLWQHQALFDWWRLHDYQPPVAISELATHDTMNATADRIFFVTHPELDEKADFANNCSVNEQTIVLGCYIGGRERIFVLHVTDPRLAGIEEVTAAHEMLHAAYDRLNSQDKQHINNLIQTAYAQVTDQRIKDTVEEYRKNGADTTNELHSILGTEVRNLPPELETYYSRYFADRSKIVAYSEAYEATFTSLKDRAKQIQTELNSLKQQIDSVQADLQSKQQSLNTQRAALDNELRAGHYDAYNAAVPGYNAQVQTYNAEITTTQALIDRYNGLLDELKTIAIQQAQLFQAIDSRNLPPKK